MKRFECHVISNTHWDREWVKSFQESRVNLADMFDALFHLFENDKDFKYYHLDAQTIPLEDYLAIRPDNVEKLRGLVKDGKLLVGPWYTLPEMNTIDGECIVRNLLTGHQVAKSFGRVMKTGYTPTSTGQVSQLPQIYQGFGIDTIIFYRGINQDVAPAEYIWESPDGTCSTAIRPPQHFSRCTFWGYIYLPVIHKYHDHIEESKQNYWHHNGFLFRMAEEQENEWTELDPVKYFDKTRLEEALNRLMSEISKHTQGNVLLALHGHDASFPHKETPRLIDELNNISEDTLFIHSNLDTYAESISNQVRSRKNNIVLRGEMRHVNQSQPWNDAHLYPGVISVKGRLKRCNRETENLLIRHAEPASAISLMTGDTYESEILDLAWKLVLANHAHDTINACSLDAVYDDAMHRFKQAQDLCRQVIRRSLARVIKKVNLTGFDKDAVLLTVFNLSPLERNGISHLAIDMPHDMSGDTLEMVDCQGKQVPLQIRHRKAHKSHVDKTGFGKTHHSIRFDVLAYFQKLPAAGYQTFLVKPSLKNKHQVPPMANGNTMENEFITVSIASDGSLAVTDKQTGKTFAGLNTFSDEGERGNAWTPERIPGAKTYLTTGNKADISLIENGPLKSTFRVVHHLMLPAASADNYSKRSQRLKKTEIRSEISLLKGHKYVMIKTSTENTVRDHRLRVLFPSGIKASHYYAATPFDVVSRPIPKPSSDDWVEPVEPSDPQTGFIGVSDGTNGLAVVNTGLYEAEVSNDSQRTIAITLLRCFYQHGNWTKERWPDEEFQNPGHHTFNYAICPHNGTWSEGMIPDIQNQTDNPFIAVQHGTGKDGHLPAEHSFLKVTGKIQMSCLKKAAEGEGLIVRLCNLSDDNLQASLQCGFDIQYAALTDLEENEITRLPAENHCVQFQAPHHKIITIKLIPAKK